MSMKRRIIRGPGFCAVTEDGILTEYIPTGTAEQCGTIMLGRAERLMPGMNCAFADIGRKKSGFLPLDEDSKTFTGGQLRSGDTMILQIKKEETGTKGAFLTRDVTLPGKLIILMPQNRYTGVSSRVADNDNRGRLRELGTEIAAGRFGLVLRQAAAEADPEMIRGEAEEKFALWQQIAAEAAKGGKPGRILYTEDPWERLKEDYEARGIDEYAECDGMEAEILRQLRAAGERIQRLPGGGSIVIDRCEAMTVIDVNTASSAVRGTKQQTVLETNLDACETIARQVRLRNLSGIILIDFIDMDTETDRSLVSERLGECFREDRIKTVIHGWTSLGLMEMTRKRTRPSLYETEMIPCAACGGKGYELREQRT